MLGDGMQGASNWRNTATWPVTAAEVGACTERLS